MILFINYVMDATYSLFIEIILIIIFILYPWSLWAIAGFPWLKPTELLSAVPGCLIRGILSMGFVLYSIFLLIYLPKEIISGLQRCLDSLQNYCGDWRLAVNLTKTKVIIFSKKAIEKYSHYFYYEPNSVEIVDSYKYVGIIFHFSGKFKASVSNLADKARKAFLPWKQNYPVTKLIGKIMVEIVQFHGCPNPNLWVRSMDNWV